jgi:hypothetical protein
MVSRQGRLFPSDGQHGSDQRAGRYCIDKRASVDRTDQLSDRRPIGRTIPLTIPARHAMTKRHSGKNSDVRYAHGVLTAPPRTRARNFFIN